MKWQLSGLSLITVSLLCGCNTPPYNAPYMAYYQSECKSKDQKYNTYNYYNYTYYGANEKYVPEYYVGDRRAGRCNGGVANCNRRGDIF